VPRIRSLYARGTLFRESQRQMFLPLAPHAVDRLRRLQTHRSCMAFRNPQVTVHLAEPPGGDPLQLRDPAEPPIFDLFVRNTLHFDQHVDGRDHLTPLQDAVHCPRHGQIQLVFLVIRRRVFSS